MEQRPELRHALHVSPTAVSVAAERMRCFHFIQRQVEANRIQSESFADHKAAKTTSIPGRLSCLLPHPSKIQISDSDGRRTRCILNCSRERLRIVSNEVSTLPSVTWCAGNNSDIKRGKKNYRSHTKCNIVSITLNSREGGQLTSGGEK